MQLSDVRTTELLVSRRAQTHLVNAVAALKPAAFMESEALVQETLKKRCEQAMSACSAQSAGISRFGANNLDSLSWLVAVGALSSRVGIEFPRHDSPCGVCFEFRSPQLFAHPQRYFRSLACANIVANELLVIPIQGYYGAFFGTMWIMNHDDPIEGFNREHVNVLNKLSRGIWCRLQDQRGTDK